MAKARSLRLRLIVAAGVWCVAGFALGGYLLSNLFADQVARSLDNRLVAMLDAVVAGSAVVDGGGVAVLREPSEPAFQAPYSGLYWQVDGPDGAVARSRSLWDQTLPATAAPPLLRDADGPNGQRLRVAAREVALPGAAQRQLFQLAADRAVSAGEVARFNRLLAWSLGAVGAGLLVALVLQVGVALRPLDAMRRALAEIRAGRAERLAGDFPSEVAPLADELNALLDHNAGVLARARTQAGNLAHALKTPLAVLANAADAADGPLADQVARQTTEMRRQVEHQLARARAAGATGTLGARTAVRPACERLLRVMRQLYAGRELSFSVDCDAGLAFAGEQQDLEEMLGNLVDNACKWGASAVAVSAQVDVGRLRVCVDDDGPGLSAEQRRQVLRRGARLDEATPGTGLGLSITAELAALCDGALHLEAAPSGGLRARLDLPAA